MNTVGAWVNSADTPRRVRLCKGTRHTRQNPVSPLSFPRLSVQLLSWRFASLREIKTVVRKTDGEGAVATHRTRPASQLARSASVRFRAWNGLPATSPHSAALSGLTLRVVV